MFTPGQGALGFYLSCVHGTLRKFCKTHLQLSPVLLQDWQSLSQDFMSHTILYPFQHLQRVFFSSNYLRHKWSLSLLLIITLLRSAILSFAECSAQHCTSSMRTEKLHAVQRFDWHTFMDALCFIRCIQENTTSFSSVLWIHKPRNSWLCSALGRYIILKTAA